MFNLLILITLISLNSGFLIYTSPPQVCFGELGCFDNEGAFHHPIYRPINLLPDNRETINTQFILHTRNNPTVDQFLKVGDDNGLTNSHFNSQNPIKFIIHGFTDSGYKPWIKELTKNLLLRGDYNVIVVDWAGGAIMKFYMQSTANTRVVAAETSLFISWLQNITGIELRNIHLIGHSLGAHISGYVGDKLKNIGRISALDPAELYFQGLDPVVRLDPTDATFIDTIHSDATSILLGGLGMMDPVGHVDFYPNGGSRQPGCDNNIITSIFDAGVSSGAYNYIACSHVRAIELFSESVLSVDEFYGAECSVYEKFLNGKCNCGQDGEKCGVMGFNAVPKSGRELVKFYLSTSSKSPYILFEYQVSVNFSWNQGTHKEKGHLYIELFRNDGKKFKKMQLSKESITMESNKLLTFLINQDSKLGDLNKLSLSWVRDSSWYNPTSWNIFNNPKLHVNNIIISPIGFGKNITFCGSAVGFTATEKMSMQVCH